MMPSTKKNTQDIDAYSDSGSTISLASCGSGGSSFAPKPPLDGLSRSKTVKGRRSKVTQQPQSPYASRQVTAKRNEGLNSKTRNLWLTSMRNGTGALSTNSTAMDTWAGSRPSHAKRQRAGSRTRNFSDIVELSNSKTRTHTRSATLSYTEPQLVGGGPALKPAEDYYDVIIELKKVINSLKEDNNILSTKLHRVEQENVMKDRKMDDLLNSRKQPEDLRRTLTDKKGDTSAIVNSLKQKLHGVERTVKEKEAEISNLKRDLKMTNMEELTIQSEEYYKEVQRLQLAMLQMQQERINYTSSRPDLYAENMLSARGKKPISAAQQRSQKDMEMLIAENRSLKKDLISAIENQSKKINKKPLNVDYADMSRAQLLQTLHQLHIKCDESMNRIRDPVKDKEEKDDRKDLQKRKDSEDNLGCSKEADLIEEGEKLRQIIERLKEDRTHYRNVADDLRKQLKAKEEEVEDLRHKLSQNNIASTTSGGMVPRRQSSTLSTASQSSARRQPVTAKERDLQMEQEFEDFKQRHAAKVLQKQWRCYQGKKQVGLWNNEQDKLKQEEAAKTLQREWKKHLKQKDRAAQDEAITDIQAAFRGHLARKGRLGELYSDSLDSNDAIISVQSAMRGHLMRSGKREENRDKWLHERARHQLSDDDDGDDDDDDVDVLIGRSSSDNKSPFSSKKRSAFTAALSSPKPTPRSQSLPQSAPRILKTPDAIPPSPAPRHKGRIPEVKVPESVSDDSIDSDDDNVIIGGSSALAQTKAGLQNKNKWPNNSQKSRADDKISATSETVESISRCKSYVDQNPEQVSGESDSDSDNDLVVCGKPGPMTKLIESKEGDGKCEQQEFIRRPENKIKIAGSSLTREKPSSTFSCESAEHSLSSEEPSITLSSENAEHSLSNEEPSSTLSNMNGESCLINEIPPSELSNNNPSTLLSANGNSDIGITEENKPNLPGLTRNRFFSGIEWSRTDKDTKDKSRSNILGTEKYNGKKNKPKISEKNLKLQHETFSLKESRPLEPFTSRDHRVSRDHITACHHISRDHTSPRDHIASSDVTTKGGHTKSSTTSNDQRTSRSHTASRDNILNVDVTMRDNARDLATPSNNAVVKKECNKWVPSKKQKHLEKGRHVKDETQEVSLRAASGLTKNINPQKTIAEVSDESDADQLKSRGQSRKQPHGQSRDQSKRKTNFKTSDSSNYKKGKQSRHEIIDSDEDDDDDNDDDDDDDRVAAFPHTKDRSGSGSKMFGKSDTFPGKPSARDYMNMSQRPKEIRKSSKKELDESEEGSSEDDVVVTSRKRLENKQKSLITTNNSSKTIASSTKRESLVDNLLSNKRTFRTSEDVRVRGRNLLKDGHGSENDDDDDDDDDIVFGSWRRRSTKEENSLKKDSLTSLWSDSSKQKKKSSSGFGFGSFGKFSSPSSRVDSSLDELF